MATTIILGSGIIGLSTAYYLSQTHPPTSIHLVDPSPTLLASASGFAGGFLAKDWFSPSLAPLGRLSFELHKKLAEKEGGREKWGYAPSSGVSLAQVRGAERGDEWLVAGGSRAGVAPGAGEEKGGPRWLVRGAGEVEAVSSGETTAQVDPRALCQFVLGSCLARGVHLHNPAQALSVSTDLATSTLSSIRILNATTNSETDIPCANLIITAGAWSGQVFSTLFPTAPEPLPISSLAGHSLVVRSPLWTKSEEGGGCHAVFTQDVVAGFSPELISRTGGEIYVAGLNDADLPLPALPADAKPHEEPVAKLKEVAKRLVVQEQGKEDVEVIREGLCFRPIVRGRSGPIVGRVEDTKLGVGVRTREGGGVWVGAGHGPWGISLSLGTGKVLAEMVGGRKLSCDVGGLVW